MSERKREGNKTKTADFVLHFVLKINENLMFSWKKRFSVFITPKVKCFFVYKEVLF